MASENIKEVTLQVLKDLRADMRGLRTEVGELRAELGAVRVEVDGLHSELREVSSDLNGLATEVGELRGEMRGEFARVWDEFGKVRGEMNVGFQARIQKDRRFLDHEGRLRLVETKTGVRRKRSP